MATEFWGVEVKAGEHKKIIPGIYKIIHVSQAALGELKDVKGAISVPIRLKIGDKSYVIGNLSAEDRPQLMLDLVIEKEFELSHDWKSGSVYFAGYMADDPCISTDDEVDSDEDDSSDDEDDSSDEEGDLELEVNGKDLIGKLEPKVKEGAGFIRNETEDSSTSDDEKAHLSLDSESEPSFMDDSDFSNDDDESIDDDAPSMDQLTKKRPSESVAEILVSAKKAKVATPEKTGGKKGQAGTAPSTGDKLKGQTPKSGKPLSSGSESGKKTKRGGK